MSLLTDHAGTWAGTNGFRLMPGDPLSEAPLKAHVAVTAAGNVTVVTYGWSHPADGEQDGVLTFGPDETGDGIAAFWGDSWHQSPAPKVLHGAATGPVVTVGYDYSGDWRWQIVVDASDPSALRLTMENVVPASAASEDLPAGPYAAMTAVLTRADRSE